MFGLEAYLYAHPDRLLLTLHAAFGVAFLFVLSLFYQAATRTNATWYIIIEKAIGAAFVAIAAAGVFLLPWSAKGIVIYLAWYLFQLVLYIVLPGQHHLGLPLKNKNNQRLAYKCNGLIIFVLSVVLFFYGGYAGWFEWSILADNFLELLWATNLFSFSFAAFLYVKGLYSSEKVSVGNIAEDFWFGLELNPMHIDSLGFDLKFFSESRPGLILWVLMNFSIAAKQHEEGGLTTPMVLVSLFHFIYIFDYFCLEQFIATTWDIFQERFGWMLLWGDYVWVPYFYCVQAWYMLFTKQKSNPLWWDVLTVVTFVVGYIVFRGANRQKHKFKENPNGPIWGKPPQVIQTKSGNKLLISGWWGLARHPNYTGDLILAFSWGMVAVYQAELTTIYVPMLYFVFMCGLLFHRFARDDERCAEKYGDDWKRYCEAVPARLIPYIF